MLYVMLYVMSCHVKSFSNVMLYAMLCYFMLCYVLCLIIAYP